MAVQDYTVASPAMKARDYDGKNGKRSVWLFMVEGGGQVEYHLPPEESPPGIGEVVNGEIKEQEFQGTKSQRLFPPYTGNGNRGGGNFDRRPEHPENAARMRWSGASANAFTAYEQLRTEKLLEAPASVDAYVATIADLASRIEKTYPGQANHPANPDDQIPFGD